MRYQEITEQVVNEQTLTVDESSESFLALVEAVQENAGEVVPDMDANDSLEFFQSIL